MKHERKRTICLFSAFLMILVFYPFMVHTFLVLQSRKDEKLLLKEYYEKHDDLAKSVSNVPVEEPVKVQEQYIGVLKIPKINIERGFYEIDSKENHVDKNIEVLKESNMPDVDKGNLIIASHSGNSNIAFFRNLDKLVLNDEVFVFYQGKTYQYKVKNIYDIEKTGKAQIIRDRNKTTLTLITCKRNNNKQIVIICELI